MAEMLAGESSAQAGNEFAQAGNYSVDSAGAITPSKTDAIFPPFPLNHARLLVDNKLFGVTISASTGTNPSYTQVPNTYQAWSFTGNGSITYSFSAVESIDSICIGAHNLKGCTVAAYYRTSLSGTLKLFANAKTVTSNNAIMFYSEAALNVQVIYITVTGTGARQVGYISAGVALQMQRPFFSGHNPITDSEKTEMYINLTESRALIGNIQRSIGQETSASWKNINDTWYRSYFEPEKETMRLYPFFFAWNLLEYPNDVGLCQPVKDISAPYSGTRNLRTLNFDLVGIL